jgi:hypothetical protein
MNKEVTIEFVRTYASPRNANRAVQAFLKMGREDMNLRYSIFPVLMEDKIRYGVLFYGQNAVQAGVHHYFNIVG